jgi:hypothetical protein
MVSATLCGPGIVVGSAKLRVASNRYAAICAAMRLREKPKLSISRALCAGIGRFSAPFV